MGGMLIGAVIGLGEMASPPKMSLAEPRGFDQEALVHQVVANELLDGRLKPLVVPIADNRYAVLLPRSAPSLCHACSGSLDVLYVDHKNGEYQIQKRYEDFAAGSDGGRPPHLVLRPDLLAGPVVISQTETEFSGLYCQVQTVILLAEAGPTTLGPGLISEYRRQGLGALKPFYRKSEFLRGDGKSFLRIKDRAGPGRLSYSWKLTPKGWVSNEPRAHRLEC